MKEFKFKAVPSGDYEAFVWAVDKKTFEKIMGRKPEKYDKSPFFKTKYMIYPDHMFNGEKELNITITVSEGDDKNEIS